MSIFKYFSEEAYAIAFMRRGVMRFGSLSYYRGVEDGGVRGDPKDGTLHYAPSGGIEITMVADGRKLVGAAFSSAAESMFVYCASKDLSAERAKDFGAFCVEITDPEALMRRLKARESPSSSLDYAQAHIGPTEYRPLDEIPGVDWAFPEHLVLIKPPEYAPQNEMRIVLPLKPGAESSDSHVLVRVGDLRMMSELHVFG